MSRDFQIIRQVYVDLDKTADSARKRYNAHKDQRDQVAYFVDSYLAYAIDKKAEQTRQAITHPVELLYNRELKRRLAEVLGQKALLATSYVEDARDNTKTPALRHQRAQEAVLQVVALLKIIARPRIIDLFWQLKSPVEKHNSLYDLLRQVYDLTLNDPEMRRFFDEVVRANSKEAPVALLIYDLERRLGIGQSRD